MKKTKFTAAQIVFALRPANTGVTVAEVRRKMGISEATYYNWRVTIALDWFYLPSAATTMGRLLRHLTHLLIALSKGLALSMSVANPYQGFHFHRRSYVNNPFASSASQAPRRSLGYRVPAGGRLSSTAVE